MDKQRQRFFQLALLLCDILIWLGSIVAAYFIRFNLFPTSETNAFRLGFYLRLSPILIIIYLFIYHLKGLFDIFHRRTITAELGLVAAANTYGFLCILMLFFWFKTVYVSRLTLLIFAACSTLLSGTVRIAARKTLRALRHHGYNIKHLLMVGCNDTANSFYDRVAANKNFGYVIDGYISASASDAHWKAKYLGGISMLDEVLKTHRIDEVMISLDYDEFHLLSTVIEVCETHGVKSSLLPFYNNYLPSKPQIEVLEDIPVINLHHIPLDNVGYAIIKRAIDILGSLFGLILISPLLLVTAVGIKLTSPGPIIYKQLRVGKNRKNFTMYKFRSMRIADNADTTTWGTEQDPRRTRFGAFIRKFSIDELPQLVNVLKGDMSLVGPRPERPFFVEKFRDEVPLYMLKHLVRPGITGWAQVNGWRGDTSILERIKCDMYYIENWSLMLDIKILLLTVFKGFINPSEKL